MYYNYNYSNWWCVSGCGGGGLCGVGGVEEGGWVGSGEQGAETVPHCQTGRNSARTARWGAQSPFCHTYVHTCIHLHLLICGLHCNVVFEPIPP